MPSLLLDPDPAPRPHGRVSRSTWLAVKNAVRKTVLWGGIALVRTLGVKVGWMLFGGTPQEFTLVNLTGRTLDTVELSLDGEAVVFEDVPHWSEVSGESGVENVDVAVHVTVDGRRRLVVERLYSREYWDGDTWTLDADHVLLGGDPR